MTYPKGISTYLPLKTDAVIELELERLSTVAKLPLLSKPYHTETIDYYLAKIQLSHPLLYQRINAYMKRYKNDIAATHFSTNISYSTKRDILLPNQRSLKTNTNLQNAFNGFWKINENLIFNAGGNIYQDNGFIPNNTFVSFGWDVFQIDVGYREHWLSPTQEGSLLISTEAKPIFNITMSNSTLLTEWNVKYEMSIGLLEKHNNIKFGDAPAVSGKPGFLTMHMSFQPLDGWTIGFNRSFMFAGNGKSISLENVWNAIIDPVNNDNCGGKGTKLQDCTQEFGNQQASLTSKLDLNIFNTLFSIYYEYAGEDTKNYNNYELGNIAQNYGMFFPYLGEKYSANFEYTKFHTAWYVHSKYGDGYSNGNIKMGHWWGNMKKPNDGGSGSAFSMRFNWQMRNGTQMSLLYRTAYFDNSNNIHYQQAKNIEIQLNHIFNQAFLGLNFYVGIDSYGQNFLKTAVTYTW